MCNRFGNLAVQRSTSQTKIIVVKKIRRRKEKNYFFFAPTFDSVVSPQWCPQKNRFLSDSPINTPNPAVSFTNISLYTSMAQSFPFSVGQPAHTHVGTAKVSSAGPLCFQPKFIAQVNQGYAFTLVLLTSTSRDMPDLLSNSPCCKLLYSIALKLRWLWISRKTAP